MGILKTLEYMMGTYKYPVPILKMRAGLHPVWIFDSAKKIKGKGGVIEYVLYKSNGKFPPPRSDEIFINNKGRDVFPKMQLEDNVYLPLKFEMGEDAISYICKGCRSEFESSDSMMSHLNGCDRIKEIVNARKENTTS